MASTPHELVDALQEAYTDIEDGEDEEDDAPHVAGDSFSDFP
jgi:hypothetical protein